MKYCWSITVQKIQFLCANCRSILRSGMRMGDLSEGSKVRRCSFQRPLLPADHPIFLSLPVWCIRPFFSYLFCIFAPFLLTRLANLLHLPVLCIQPFLFVGILHFFTGRPCLFDLLFILNFPYTNRRCIFFFPCLLGVLSHFSLNFFLHLVGLACYLSLPVWCIQPIFAAGFFSSPSSSPLPDYLMHSTKNPSCPHQLTFNPFSKC